MCNARVCLLPNRLSCGLLAADSLIAASSPSLCRPPPSCFCLFFSPPSRPLLHAHLPLLPCLPPTQTPDCRLLQRRQVHALSNAPINSSPRRHPASGHPAPLFAQFLSVLLDLFFSPSLSYARLPVHRKSTCFCHLPPGRTCRHHPRAYLATKKAGPQHPPERRTVIQVFFSLPRSRR